MSSKMRPETAAGIAQGIRTTALSIPRSGKRSFKTKAIISPNASSSGTDTSANKQVKRTA